MRLYLIGLPGSGKTRIGRKLASRLSVEFIDIDNIIEEKNNSHPSTIIREKGEDYFRKLETKALKEITVSNAVISTGGGIIERSENKHLMRGKVIYLEINPDAIKLNHDEIKSRPILEEKGIMKLFIERECRYLDFSDIIISIDKRSDEEVIEEVLKKIWKY